MKKLLVLSGKGGTGKTTVSAGIVELLNIKAAADCDVDAPNLHLLVNKYDNLKKSTFMGAQKAFIDKDLCINCGKCKEHCNFDAIKQMDGYCEINEYACEGCSVCELVCPNNACKMYDDKAGTLYLYQGNGILSSAKLKMGRGNSGKLVADVKKQLYNNADEPLAVIDGSPGIGCPVIASISGVDMVLIVTEPSLSGLSDLKRIIKTAKTFNVDVAILINKFDKSNTICDDIINYCKENSLDYVGNLPYDKRVGKLLNQGKTIAQSSLKGELEKIIKNITTLLRRKDNENSSCNS